MYEDYNYWCINALYRSPNGRLERFLSFFRKNCEEYLYENMQVVIMGDFNIRHWENDCHIQ